jgi:hypothetical protein
MENLGLGDKIQGIKTINDSIGLIEGTKNNPFGR